LTPPNPIHGQTDYAFQIEPSAAGDNCAGSSNVGYGAQSQTGASPGAGYEISDSLFIDATGAFANSELQFGDSPGVAGTFANSTHASGSWTNLVEGCSGPLYNWSASPQ
jgi:hypothetical protein